MSLWVYLIIIFAAGAIGGAVNALLTDNGFILPRPVEANGVKILRPGFLGNLLVSGVAASVSWGLYGPFAVSVIVGRSPDGAPPEIGLTVSSLVGALLVGIVGARWLTNEVDKKLLRLAASESAAMQADAVLSRRITAASPAEAVALVTRAR